jgi:hypothetical protein
LWSRNPELGVATLALAIAEAAVILVLVVVLIIMCCRKKATVAPETPKRASAEDDGPYLHDEDPAYHAHDQDSDGEDGAPSKKAKGSSKQAKAAAAAAAARRSYERTKLRPSERLGREELLLVMRDPAMYAVLRKRDAAWETWESGTARAASAAEGAQPMKPLVADTGRTIDVTAGHRDPALDGAGVPSGGALVVAAPACAACAPAAAPAAAPDAPPDALARLPPASRRTLVPLRPL